jgi:uncharacterized protein YigE (DUF2233 family)
MPFSRCPGFATPDFPHFPYLHLQLSPMAKYLLFGYCIIGLLACNNLSPETKKQIAKGKELAKQVKATVEHIDLKQDYIGYEAHPDSGSIRMYWKDGNGSILGSLQNLKNQVEQQGSTLLYGCNGGMYMENRAPLGYYIENGKTVQKINTRNGSGNFYMPPKGVFYVLKNGQAKVQSIETPKNRAALPTASIRYLTQSGPMLLHKGAINSQFKPGSNNINIRNGVGILPNGHAYFAMSTYPVSFYDFAQHFISKGCREALYFDGFVSRTYCPQTQYTQLGGNFGVMVAVVKE